MLKSLELTGFKSFADRTVFRFDAGLTAVVGPNGSGKSNVVDGLKWLLGDQSPKSLRGKEMADVIFNGTATRGPGGSAEAVLTFDNTTRFLPFDDDAVTVGRRLLRSGDSEYRLNGQAARLKDVRDLFAGTGFGKSGYAIIEQGRVDQIIRANASGRRAVFEEVAGIARFRLCRADAERKLERVDQNVERLTDVVDELEAQLTATRTQAAKAATFRELKKELRAWWVGWAADEARLTDVIERRAGRAADDAAAGAERLTTEQARLAGLRDKVEADLSRAEAEFNAADRARAAAAATSEQLQLQADGFAARTHTAEAVVTAARRRLAAARQAAAEASAERDGLADTVDALRDALAKLPAPTDSPAVDADGFEERALLDAIDRVEQECHGVAVRLEAARTACREAELRLARDEERAAAAEAAEARWAAEAATVSAVAAETARHAAHRRAVAALADELRGSAAAAAARRDARIREINGRLLRAEARLSVLDDLDREEGPFGLGVREFLKRSRTATGPPWSDVRGTVAELIEVSVADAALIDVALGPRASYVVVDRLDRVAAYVAKESARLTDRLGFITRESESESRDATVDLAGLPGVIGPAADLVRDAADAEGLTRRLLATTWIVESVAIATSLAAGRGHGLRFVTPQGELLEADGTLTAGSVAPRARVVSRQSEKRALRAEITRLRAGAEGASSAAGDESDDRLVRATEAMLTRAAAIATADSDLASENRATAQSRSVESARDAEAARQCVEGSGRELEARREEVTDLESARSKLNDRRDDLTASLERLHKQADTERENAASETTASERVRLEERLAAAVDSLTRSEADLGRHAQVIGQARADLSGADEASTRATLAELAAAAVRADAFAEVSAAAEDCERLAARRDRLRASHRTLEERTRGIDAESSRLRGYEATASAYVVEARARRDQLCTRVAEEFDVSHDELLAGEASALRLLDGDDADALAAVDLERLVEEREGIEKRVDRLRRKLKAIGAVNPDSLADLDALEERHTRLASQLADLTEARAALRGVIDRVDAESRKLFSETFEVVRGHFRELFRQVFGGGDGDVVLEDPTDPLAGGVEIIARPPGKEPRGLSLLSGGEKTMTCVALMFALFRAKPSPFCVLDEVDAALDEANIERFVRVLELFKRETQFVMITHRKPSMAAADVLHGVTMEDAGVSKRLAIRLDEVADDGAIATTRRAA